MKKTFDLADTRKPSWSRREQGGQAGAEGWLDEEDTTGAQLAGRERKRDSSADQTNYLRPGSAAKPDHNKKEKLRSHGERHLLLH